MPYRRLTRAAQRATGRLGWLRGAVGAVLGIAMAALIASIFVGADDPSLPWLVAPIGASAVLVFALPASPLAQPWSVFGGDILSALVGLMVWHFIPVTALGAPLAVGGAIAVMSLCRCLHPPGGACALLAVLCGPMVAEHGWLALMLPLGLNVVALTGMAWLYNNLTGHQWPHQLQPVVQPVPEGWLGSYEAGDLDAVLEDWDEVLDVNRDDLDALFCAVERRVQRRWMESTLNEMRPLSGRADPAREPGSPEPPALPADEAA
ncbi:MAG: HPP family protein [Novosphingobium sp.]